MLLAWLLWWLTVVIYLQSAPVIANLPFFVSLALTITAIVLGAKGRRRARRTATSRAAASWGLGLGIAHLTLGFVAPTLASLAFFIASRG